MTPTITFIVSAFSRPDYLRCCLSMLLIQTLQNFEIIVTDNAIDPAIAAQHHHLCAIDPRITYIPTAALDCYWSAEMVLDRAKGEWLAFPSDDSYYVPLFAEKMTSFANQCAADFIYCDFIWGRQWQGQWLFTYCDAAPQMCHIDKTTFILRRDKMIPFPSKNPHGTSGGCDGLLAEELVRQGIRHRRLPEVLVCHN